MPNSASRSKQKETKVVVLPNRFTIAEVANVKHKLEVALDSGCTVSIDACSVERVDTAALQLMVAFWSVAPAEGVEIVWDKPTDVFRASAADLGLARLLRLE